MVTAAEEALTAIQNRFTALIEFQRKVEVRNMQENVENRMIFYQNAIKKLTFAREMNQKQSQNLIQSIEMTNMISGDVENQLKSTVSTVTEVYLPLSDLEISRSALIEALKQVNSLEIEKNRLSSELEEIENLLKNEQKSTETAENSISEIENRCEKMAENLQKTHRNCEFELSEISKFESEIENLNCEIATLESEFRHLDTVNSYISERKSVLQNRILVLNSQFRIFHPDAKSKSVKKSQKSSFNPYNSHISR